MDDRLSPYTWDLLVNQLFGTHKSWITPPQKFFLWNDKGIYVDYHYANPIHGHYVGGDCLLGKRITQVLPQPMAKGVRMAVFQTLDLQQPLIEYYELTMNKQPYQVHVRFLPFQGKVLGIVNDYPAQSDTKILTTTSTKKRQSH
ncbi:MAG: hypothetical protein ACPGYT_06450 [Nitrospirales bacterium]